MCIESLPSTPVHCAISSCSSALNANLERTRKKYQSKLRQLEQQILGPMLKKQFGKSLIAGNDGTLERSGDGVVFSNSSSSASSSGSETS